MKAPANSAKPPALDLSGGFAARLAALRGWRRRGAAFLLGLLAALALPPLYLFPLLIGGLTGLVWLIDSRRPGLASFSAGWWWGFGHFIVAFYWIGESFLVDPVRFGWMIPFAIGGLAGYMALFIGAAALATRWLDLTGPAKVIAFAIFWTAGEWLRGHLFTGFPWGLAGYALAFSDALNQYAAVGGIWGLSLLTVVIAAMPSTLGETHHRRALWSCAGALLLAVLLFAGGAIRLAGASSAMVPNVILRIVQPNIAQSDKWIPGSGEQHVALLRGLTLQVQGWEHISATIWPETAVQFLLDRNDRLRQYLGQAVPPGALVLTGTFRGDPPTGDYQQLFNSLLAVDHDGTLLGSADKFHLVPMGEYVPLRRIFPFISKLAPSPDDFSAGPGPRSLKLPGLPPAGALICYEVIFPGRVVDSNDRPAWLLNITNDAWFGTSFGPYQHFTSARLRAVEEGLPLVRAANTGISGLIDPYGQVIEVIALSQPGVRDVPLPAALDGLTPYARFGDMTLLVQFLLAAVVAGFLRRKRL
ncbi:MAG TPA: apolipoprotein N-acyltransferase [Candidatus Polarisedimenticolia bacterium]|jgi:apolipoprotein N-acyltransferase|nr:apolipoprotein N-acyltransferase [Dongiaceae bacterium]HYV89738.1 apolipoprotein N-acyltransferase [Candidatus Polarisedimenticolia bacterium]